MSSLTVVKMSREVADGGGQNGTLGVDASANKSKESSSPYETLSSMR